MIGRKIRRWRLLGASALELCYVGCGRIDGFIDVRGGTLRVTDAAAGGMLICEEAGGGRSPISKGMPLSSLKRSPSGAVSSPRTAPCTTKLLST